MKYLQILIPQHSTAEKWRIREKKKSLAALKWFSYSRQRPFCYYSRWLNVYKENNEKRYRVDKNRTYVAINVSFVKSIIGWQVFLKIPYAYRIVAGTSDETTRWHSISRVSSSRIHFDAPYAGRVIKKRVRLSNSPNVSNVPDVYTVIVVNARELVVTLVECESYSVRVSRVCWMLWHVTEEINKKGINKINSRGNIILCSSCIIYSKCSVQRYKLHSLVSLKWIENSLTNQQSKNHLQIFASTTNSFIVFFSLSNSSNEFFSILYRSFFFSWIRMKTDVEEKTIGELLTSIWWNEK